MIDVHCHLEQPDYREDRNEIIKKCQQELKAVITSCAHPKDFKLTMELVEKYKGFVFASVGLHPEYVKEIKESEIEEYLEKIKANKEKIVSIGEIGLDYFWVKEADWQRKQQELFSRLLEFAKEIKKPVTVHIRDAFEDAIRILEQSGIQKVHLHMFGGRRLLQRVLDNGWMISENTIILTSKNYKKIVRDTPLERLMLETDSPWLGLEHKRNDPTSVRIVANRIAEIKKTTFEEVDKKTTKNAIEFFELPLKSFSI